MKILGSEIRVREVRVWKGLREKVKGRSGNIGDWPVKGGGGAPGMWVESVFCRVERVEMGEELGSVGSFS